MRGVNLVVFRQLFREFWLPLCVSIIWAFVGYFSAGHDLPTWFVFVKDLSASFFLVSWATGQYFRVKKQSQVETHLVGIVERLSDVVKRVEEAGERSAALITGGDGFCFVELSNFSSDSNCCLFSLRNDGNLPLFDVRVRVVDVDELQRLAGGKSTISLNDGSTTVDAGTVFPGVTGALRVWTLSGGKFPRRLFIEIEARNGRVTQEMALWIVEGELRTATRVWREGGVFFTDVDKDLLLVPGGDPFAF